jgi:hypothetical protein
VPTGGRCPRSNRLLRVLGLVMFWPGTN